MDEISILGTVDTRNTAGGAGTAAGGAGTPAATCGFELCWNFAAASWDCCCCELGSDQFSAGRDWCFLQPPMLSLSFLFFFFSFFLLFLLFPPLSDIWLPQLIVLGQV